MFKKLMKHLTNNMGLKILSILFSVVLWMIVVKFADPDASKNFSIPVEILNKNVIEEMGKVPDVVDDTDIAMFSVTGPRSYVENLYADDFTVTADLSQADLSQDDGVKLVPIEISVKKYEKYITINKRTVNMRVTLEERSEQKFIISPEMTGIPAEGCAIGAAEVTPNLLTISGPESVVSKISKVVATINVDGVSSDVSDNVTPVLYDEEGNVIISELLRLSQSQVTIKANILGTKTVSIRCGVTGTPAEGYEYKGLEYAPEIIVVKGEPEVLNNFPYIDIPDHVINIDGASADVETTVDISTYLTEGISLVDDSANQIAVKAVIERKDSKVFNLPVDTINISGLSNNYELAFGGKTVPVTIRALKEDMDAFEVTEIQATMNVEALEPGTHTVQLELTINNSKYEMVGTVSVQITIKDKNAPEEDDGNSGNADDTGNSGESSGSTENNETQEDGTTNSNDKKPVDGTQGETQE